MRTSLSITSIPFLICMLVVRAVALDGSLPSPKGEIVLTVTGNIARTNEGDTAVFDRQMLRDLGEVSYTTSTIWTDEAIEFTGPTLHSLLDVLGVEEGAIETVALNDYFVTIPVDEIEESAPILAMQMDGRDMTVRMKGPLWVIYPFDSDPRYQNTLTQSRSIWQLKQINVIDGAPD